MSAPLLCTHGPTSPGCPLCADGQLYRPTIRLADSTLERAGQPAAVAKPADPEPCSLWRRLMRAVGLVAP